MIDNLSTMALFLPSSTSAVTWNGGCSIQTWAGWVGFWYEIDEIDSQSPEKTKVHSVKHSNGNFPTTTAKLLIGKSSMNDVMFHDFLTNHVWLPQATIGIELWNNHEPSTLLGRSKVKSSRIKNLGSPEKFTSTARKLDIHLPRSHGKLIGKSYWPIHVGWLANVWLAKTNLNGC